MIPVPISVIRPTRKIMNQKSRKPTVGEALVELLADYGVELIFGIPGTHSIELYRGLGASNIRHISPRHEQGGGFMADGYARISGKPGVCFVITGPGVTNIATPLGEAYMDAVPMLVISPVNEPDADNHNRGRLHEITNQSAVTAPLTAFSATVEQPDEIPQLLARAFALFASERPAPVHISIPLSILPMPVTKKWRAESLSLPKLGEREQLHEVALALQRAQKPVIVAGGGACGCAENILRLAQEIPCPLLTTVAGRGIIPDDHPLCAGAQLRSSGIQKLLADSDLGVFIGTELAEPDHWSENLILPQQQIWINLDRVLLERISQQKTHNTITIIHGEADHAVQLISESIPPLSEAKLSAARKRCDHARAAVKKEYTRMEKTHLKVIDKILAHLPADTIIASDMTQLAYTAIDFVPLAKPNLWLHPCGYGTLGYALPAAIGALLARPHASASALASALVIVGDAGLQYTMQEMTLAAELKLNLVLLLWNNDALQQIRDDMDAAGIQPLGVRQQNPDFIALAHACGWRAQVVESLSTLGGELENAFEHAIERNQPVLLRLDQHSIISE